MPVNLNHYIIIAKQQYVVTQLTTRNSYTMAYIVNYITTIFSNRILIIVGWTCLLTLCQSKVIEVNNEGNDSNSCCTEGTCLCGSLVKALHMIKSNTMINITSSSVTFHSYIEMGLGNLNNITIMGNGAIVACNNSGFFICSYCSNVVIQGITWDQCGNPNHPIYLYGIAFVGATDISIETCTFQFSKVCKTVILSLLSGYVEVIDSRFLFNYVINSSQCRVAGYGSLGIISEATQDIFIFITGTLFDYNGALDYDEQYVHSMSSAFYSSVSSHSNAHYVIINSTISNSLGLGSYLHNSENNVVAMQLTNFTLLNNSDGGLVIVVTSYSFQTATASINIYSSTFAHNINGSLNLIVATEQTSIVEFYGLTIVRNKGTFRKDKLNININDQGTGILMSLISPFIKLNMSFCNIHKNVGSKSIVYISVKQSVASIKSITSCNFTNNIGSALYLSSTTIDLEGNILFMNNLAESGAAMYFVESAEITIKNGSIIQFIGNIAASQGGAIFIEMSFGCPKPIAILFTNSSTVMFINNSAGFTGNSIYFDIPESCDVVRDPTKNNSIVYAPNKFNYTSSAIGSPITTSPYKISLCSKACHLSDNTSSSCYVPRRVMLGQSIGINATVCDYYNNISEPVKFVIECNNCNNKYRLSSNGIIIHNGLFHITFLAVGADNDIVDNTNVTLNLSSVLSSKYRQLTATISLQLSSCQSGYVFDTNTQQCKCYEQSEDIIQCQQDYAEIKYGYWFGIAVFPMRTVSSCPIHYCDYDSHAETTNGYYKLPEELDDQCYSHRTGVACGECKPGYTLAYDSPDCINTDNCYAGMTVLVLVSTILYSVIVVALVFGLMQFKISLGYIYGLIYFYSIIDILLGSNLFISEGVFQLVTILSSFAKLTPQFLGKLCFVQGLSGIDQQFIHYFHAMSVFLLIGGIVITTRFSFEIASIVSRCILRVICLLILLSYTSLASTSLQLLRPLHFDDVDGVYVYSSPSIKYFTGRHIPYGIIALLCELFIVIGLPLLLLLEPFLQRKFNFIKIKPLLDQFQECYKDQYRCFAAYYFICRQIIIALVYISNFNNAQYFLQTICIITVLIHIWTQPYRNEKLNTLDGVILLIMVLVVNLNLFAFSRSSTVIIVVVVMAFPLLLSCFIYATIFFKKKTATSGVQNVVPWYVNSYL